MQIDLKAIPSFGVAGNFTGHLEQAGEARDFVNVKAREGAPKALFPTYIPLGQNKSSLSPDQPQLLDKSPNQPSLSDKSSVPSFLTVFPFDAGKIIYPDGEDKLQIEPECALICNLEYKCDKVSALKPLYFTASNDCSIRKEGARKISLKKNWGPSSKGLSEKLLKIDSFSEQGNINNYRIASFLVRKSGDSFVAYDYGEDSAIRDYSYIYDTLLDWIIEKLNNQKDEGPAENVASYLLEAGKPSQIIVSIGATRYTSFGEENFLREGDYSLVILYPEGKYTKEEIKAIALKEDCDYDDISILRQRIEKKL